MFGDFPPSSSDTRARFPDASCMISLPTSVEPVNAILSTCARVNAAPVVSPGPVITLSTPSGTPASCAIFASHNAVSGVSSAGFNTDVFPNASAGATFHDAITSGKFHGMICAHTPTGSRSVYTNVSVPVGLVSP